MNTVNNSWVFLCVLVFGLAVCSKPHPTIAVEDTISLFDSLTGNQTIISKGGIFELGFFKPGKSDNHYIGIWYKFSVQTVVWVANRDAPVPDSSSSKFTFLDGNLVLLSDFSNIPIWSTNLASNPPNTTQVVLGDDGNLVLRDGSNPSVVYWQSFDHPSDTWLPGGKLGFNRKTNQSQQLTSWRSREDPATGFYSLKSNGTNQYFIYWNNSEEIWRTGEWNETAKSFGSTDLRFNSIYNYSYISNVNESYFTYSFYNKSTISRLVMDLSGQIKQLQWSESMRNWTMVWAQPNRLCDVHSICGAFGNCNQDTQKCECLPGFAPRYPTNWSLQDSSGGCARTTPLQCGRKDGFSAIQTSNLPDNPRSPKINSAEECKAACEDTCSCNAYTFDRQCQLWDGDIMNLNQLTSSARPATFYVRLAAAEIPSLEPVSTAEVKSRKPIAWKIIIPVSILGAAIMGVLGYTCIHLYKRNKANKRGRLKELHGVLTDLLKFKATYNDTPNTNTFDDGKTKGETHELQIFSLVCLSNATNNFCLNNKLGEGGFGPVYKGKLRNEQEIAVKRLSKSSGQGIEEFKNEVVLISKLQHRNLVKLLGCCVEGDEYMLIYEYMPKRSLDRFLFDPRKKALLNWEKRFNIIGGIARGLLYLHRDSRLRVIHRDLKVGNILLDENMTPKISDFGMARIFGSDQTIDSTNRVVGTFGYMSPEYVMGGTFSEKSDVFSFGVLILEIVSSKRNNSFYNPEQPSNLLLHTWRLWNEGEWSEIVDDSLGELYSQEEVIKCVHIGLLCVQNRAIDRPTMAEVDTMLGSETDRPAPKEPPYSFSTSSSEKTGSEPNFCYSNDVTFSGVAGR